jgi:hypothetical protein
VDSIQYRTRWLRGRGHGLDPGLAWACLDAACLWEVARLVRAVMLIGLSLFCGAK